MLELPILILVVLVLSGFFSGAEAALVSITSAEVETMVQRQYVGATVLASVKENLSRAIIAIVVMNNIVNIVGSIMVGRAVLHTYGDAMLGVATTALTFSVILFSEIIPKTLGMHYAHHIAIPIAGMIRILMLILSPVIYVMEVITDLLKKGERKIGTEDQIRSLVTIGRRSGHIESDEGQLIHRAFILNDKRASDIMTPLKNMVSIPATTTIKQAAEIVEHSGLSRFPVFDTSVHALKGVAMSKDMLEAILDGHADRPITTILREGFTVPSGTRSDKLIELFRDKHTLLAVVQDQGKTVGLVTLEDVLEELVGEIEDETDSED